MSADDHARVISPQKQQMLVFEVVVSVDPIFKGQIGENVVGLGNKDLATWLLFHACLVIRDSFIGESRLGDVKHARSESS